MDDGAPVDARTRRHPLGCAVAMLGWLVVAGVVAFLVVRVVAYDTRRVTIAANAYTPYWFLPIYPVLVFAALTRRRALILASAVLVMVHVLFVAPRLGAEDVPAAARDARPLVVLSANLSAENRTPEVLAREILDADADVVALEELTYRWDAVFEDLGFAARYPYRVAYLQNGVKGIGLYSRLPISRDRIEWVEGRPIARADVAADAGTVHVVAVHPAPPHGNRREHRRQVDAYAQLVEARDGPLVLMGDLNATLYNRSLRHLLAGDLRSAHDARGRSLWASSWPNGTRSAPPALIDHVLVSSDIAVLAVREGDGAGSDHRPVIADLALLPNRAKDR